MPNVCRFRCRKFLLPPRASVAPTEVEGQVRSTERSMLQTGLGYSFTPGGLLLPYYTGVISALSDLGLLEAGTPVAGASLGAIASAMTVSGLAFEEIMEANKCLQTEIIQKGALWKLADILQNTLMEVLPADIHIRASGRVAIAVTIYQPWKPLQGEILEEFADKEDFVDAIVASCYIPFYLGPSVGISYRGRLYSDGLPTNFFPPLPKAAKEQVERTVTVTAFPKLNRAYLEGPGVDISPDSRPQSDRFSSWQYLSMTLRPYPLQDMDKLARYGYEDGAKWGENYLQNKIREKSLVI